MQSEIWESVSRLRIEGDHSIWENPHMKLSAQFDYQEVDHEKDNTVRLLISVEAPAIDWVAQRPKVCVLPVIDISGSMQGQKFEYAREACRKLIEHLKPGDYAGLVSFAYRAKVVVKPWVVTAELKTELLKALGQLVPDGGTNFHEALTKSLGALGSLDLPPSILHRVIFFTDGEPTSGVVDKVAIKAALTQNLQSFSMSFFGYGGESCGTCDQQFLTELSELGKGNYAYVQKPDDALSAFGRELGGLLSTYATDLRLVIEPRNGHTVEKLITSLGSGADEPATSVTELALELGDILAEEQRHVVLECSIKQQDKALPRDFTAFNVTATCRRVSQDGTKAAEEATAPARIRFVKPSDAQKKPTPEVDKIVALHQLALAQKEAEARAAEGKFAEAQSVLSNFSAEAKTRGYIHVAGVASKMQQGLMSSNTYSTSQGYRKSVGSALLRSARVASYDVSAQADLDNLPLGGAGTSGTAAQAAYSELFTSNAAAPDPAAQWVPTPTIPGSQGAGAAPGTLPFLVVPTPAPTPVTEEEEPAASLGD